MTDTQSQDPRTARWRYKVTYTLTEEHMNDTARDGWELVTVLDETGALHPALIWKRPK